jgi:hypothetical protein
MTTFENKCIILADFWVAFKSNPDFTEFYEYNDIGLPIAYALDNGIVKGTELSNRFVDETFDMLLAAFEIPEDTGFESLEDVLAIAG